MFDLKKIFENLFGQSTKSAPQPATTAQPKYSYKQRADKGFDFYKGNNKVYMDEYLDNTGADKQSLLREMAMKGDKVSQQAIRQPIQRQPLVPQGLQGPQVASTKQSIARKPVQKDNNDLGTFVSEYLNPFGSEGIFGAKSIAQNTNTIQKVADTYRSGVDTVLQNKGNNKFDDPRDVLRLVANLPVGMLQGVAEAPKDVRETLSGKRLALDNQGLYNDQAKDLSGLQRAGALGNAFINTAGLAFGGSGTLLSSLSKQGAKQATTSLLRQVATDALKEGGEEAVQSLMSDLQYQGGFDDGTLSRASQGFAVGAGAGGLMSGGGKVINVVRDPNVRQQVTTSLVSKVNDIKSSPLGQTIPADEAGSLNIGQIASDIKDKFTGRPTNLTDAELDVARRMTQYNSGFGQNPSTQDAMIFRQIEQKLGAQPGTPDGMQAVNNALKEQRTWETKRRQAEAGFAKASNFDPTGKLGKADPMEAVRAEMKASGIDGNQAARKLGIEKEYDRAIKAEYAKSFRESNTPILPPAPQVTKTPDLPIVGPNLSKTSSAKVETPTKVQPQAKQVNPLIPDAKTKQAVEALPQEVKTRLDNLVKSSKLNPNALQDSLKTPLGQVLGDLRSEADTMPTFNAVAGSKGTTSTQRLVKAVNENKRLANAVKATKQNGQEMNFYAKKDAGGRSIGVEIFNPKRNKIEAGFVTDRDGNILGNHIKVDETGIQVNVGGDLVNMERVIGNPQDWKGKYRIGETMSRNIDSNAPNKQIARQTKDYLVGSKVKAEADYRVELQNEYKNLGKRIDRTEKARPANVDAKTYDDDVFSVLNGDKTDVQIRKAYDKPAADAILGYKKETRSLYNSLLERINKERVKFGREAIEPRKDYITHLQEMNANKSFTGEVYTNIKNSFVDDGMATTRGSVPSTIAGRTETFKPISAYNRFLQRRTGEKSLRDPYKAVQEYLEPALYNIHMTEATVRARAVESAFRTAGQLKEMSGTNVIDYTGELLKPYRKDLGNAKLVAGFAEYANALGKKTQRWDRQIIDASDASALGLKGWQKLQRVGGSATIAGNISSVLSQPLNQAVGLADAGPKNWLTGVARAIGGDKSIEQSNFIKARRTRAIEPIRTAGRKIMDVGALPLEKVEMASIEVIWHSQHAKAQKAGETGAKAIQTADYNTERLVAGRGIADKPELYRSTLANGLLQYTLEVSAQNKVFWKDLKPSQKATFMVAAMAMNSVYENVTGASPLPDFLGAAIDTGEDFMDEDDKRSAGEKAIGGVQRFAGEAVGMNPFGAAIANTALTSQQRKDLFGDDSDLGRYEGTAAPVKVIQNSVSAAQKAIEGNFLGARNDALKTVPFGNQARKTLTGVEANLRGYAVDSKGQPTFGVSDNPLKQTQNALFGPFASNEAKQFYDNKMTSFSKNQTELLESLPKSEQKNFFEQIFNEKVATNQTNKELKNLDTSDSTVELKSGKIAYQLPDGTWKAADNQADADKALSKAKRDSNIDEFKSSDENFMEKDGYVYRKDDEGKVQTMTKADYDYKVTDKTMDIQKDQNDLEGWMKSAETQMKYLEDQMNDPNTDKLDKLDIQTKAQTLYEQILKYQSYGGFKKGRSGRKGGRKGSSSKYAGGFEDMLKISKGSQGDLRDLIKQIKITRKRIGK